MEAAVVDERTARREWDRGNKRQQAAEPRVKILLLEDNPGDARLIDLMFTQAAEGRFETEHVDTLGVALHRLAQGGIGVVLADLSLPDSHGIETFERLHARAPQVPIIVLSGLNDTTLAVQAVHEGAQDYLIKGQVDGQLLVRAIRYAIERKRMSEQLAHYADELRTRNTQLQADLNMAREIQEIFMPQQYPTFPHWVAPEESALRFSHCYLPAAEVGGDFFSIFPITDSTAGVFICDVMGHGMRGALITAIMRGLVEELMPVAADPGKFLTEVNRSLHRILSRTREPFLATAAYLVADVASPELRFASAGHPSPFRLQRQTGIAQPLKLIDPRHGPALGLFDKSLYPTCRSPLQTNDMLLLFTDGVYEIDNSHQEEYSQERLLDFVKRHLNLPSEQLLQQILQDVRKFSGAGEFDDDVCLVGVEVARTL
ncbi:MAG TPA: SpoIIE family protein phosphatase [Candidatus Dormibacteraeota bacterium]|nr:SpoIIE family protein phosphatase [Candidatus Dormibacteraeota bacterium]